MTMPNTALERKRLRNEYTLFRGHESFGVEASSTVPEKDEADTTMDDFVSRRSASEEEDMYLPRDIPAIVETLPQLLRASCKSDRNAIRHEVADLRKLRVSEGLRNLVSNLFPKEQRPSKVAAHVLSAESMMIQDDDRTRTDYSVVLIQDYLPILRTIGLLERIAERTETKPEHRTSGRVTRKQAAARRHHYYDKISRTLGLDQGTMSSTEVGAKMADGLLQYYKDTTTSNN
jgi:hypothetical protein